MLFTGCIDVDYMVLKYCNIKTIKLLQRSQNKSIKQIINMLCNGNISISCVAKMAFISERLDIVKILYNDSDYITNFTDYLIACSKKNNDIVTYIYKHDKNIGKQYCELCESRTHNLSSEKCNYKIAINNSIHKDVYMDKTRLYSNNCEYCNQYIDTYTDFTTMNEKIYNTGFSRDLNKYYINYKDVYIEGIIVAIENNNLNTLELIIKNCNSKQATTIESITQERCRKSQIRKIVNLALIKNNISIIEFLFKVFKLNNFKIFTNNSYINNYKPRQKLCSNYNLNVGTLKLLNNYNIDTSKVVEKILAKNALNNNIESVTYLCTLGLNINIYNKALRSAAKNGHCIIINKLLVNGANVNHKNNASLIKSIKKGHLEAIKLLCNRGANIKARSNKPIKLAIKYKYFDIVEYLFKQNKHTEVDINTYIMLAVISKNMDIFNYLYSKTQPNDTLIHQILLVALTNENVDIVKRIYNNNPNILKLNNYEAYFTRPIKNNKEIYKMLLNKIKNDIDIDKKTNRIDTLFYLETMVRKTDNINSLYTSNCVEKNKHYFLSNCDKHNIRAYNTIDTDNYFTL